MAKVKERAILIVKAISMILMARKLKAMATVRIKRAHGKTKAHNRGTVRLIWRYLTFEIKLKSI